jgi:hypothetical protein
MAKILGVDNIVKKAAKKRGVDLRPLEEFALETGVLKTQAAAFGRRKRVSRKRSKSIRRRSNKAAKKRRRSRS